LPLSLLRLRFTLSFGLPAKGFLGNRSFDFEKSADFEKPVDFVKPVGLDVLGLPLKSGPRDGRGA
jgi:hypothetical protein